MIQFVERAVCIGALISVVACASQPANKTAPSPTSQTSSPMPPEVMSAPSASALSDSDPPPAAPQVRAGARCQNGGAASTYSAPGRDILTAELRSKIRDALLVEGEKTRKSPSHFINIDAEVEATFGLSNQSPPNTTAACCHPREGIVFVVPFNRTWVTAGYALPPCEFEHDQLHFGPLRYDWHGHHLFRDTSLELLPPRSTKAALETINRTADLPAGQPAKLIAVGERSAVAYVDEPPESPPIQTIEVMGESRNVLLTTTGFDLGLRGSVVNDNGSTDATERSSRCAGASMA